MEKGVPVDRKADFRLLSGHLKDAHFFRGLRDDERDTVLTSMVSEQFDAGEVVIRQDTVTRNVWLLLDGQCEVVKEPSNGSYGVPVRLAQLRPFDVFGEMNLTSGEPHVASVETRTTVRTLRLRGTDFDELANLQPRIACQLACNLLYIVSERLRSVDEELSNKLDRHEDVEIRHAWEEIHDRIGRLYAGTPE